MSTRKEVTKAEFYGAIYSQHLNVHPMPVGNWDNETGAYHTEWRTPSGYVWGLSFGAQFWINANEPTR